MPENNKLDDLSLDERFEFVLGKEELDRQKTLWTKRKLKPDFKEGLPNITECKMCGSDDVPNTEVNVDIGIMGIISVKVRGAKCNDCSEIYYKAHDLLMIEKWLEILKKEEQFNHKK